MLIHLPEPHEGQLKVLESKAKYKILCCGRRWGKSLICQVISITSMLNGERVGYVTPAYSLGKEFFREILKLLPKQVVKEANKSEMRIELITGGSLVFVSGDANALEDAVRGRKFHKVIVDEAAKIPGLEEAWTNAILPTLTDYNGDALLVSTPRGKNFFYQLYKKGLNKEENFESFNYRTEDNLHLPVEAIENMKKAMTAAAYKQEMLAIPTENEDNPFTPESIERNTIKELSKTETIVYGIDLGQKVDSTVIVGLDEDGNQTHFEQFQLPWPETLDRIKSLPSQIAKVMDVTGLGGPVYGMLENEVRQLRPFIFTNKSKTDIMQQLIKDLEMDKVKVIKQVANELYTMEQRETSHGNMKYEAQAGYHDDCVAALAMANNFRAKEHVSKNWKLWAL